MAKDQRRGKSRMRRGVGSGEEVSETSNIEGAEPLPAKPQPEAFLRTRSILFFQAVEHNVKRLRCRFNTRVFRRHHRLGGL